jgi:GntR family transcriptional repressor for pyruvate dehydrogenase complex
MSGAQLKLEKSLVRAPLYRQVASAIEDLVQRGELKPGDRLPTEKEMCELFGVSRTVVREAVRVLADRYAVVTEAGRGTFISPFDPAMLSKQIRRVLASSNEVLEGLSEVRRPLEMEVARLAARRANDDDLRKAKAALDSMDRDCTTDEFINADHNFHVALAESTRNPLFLILVHSLSDLLLETRRTAVRAPGATIRAQKWHRAVWEAVRQGDPDAAAEAMATHLDVVRRELERVKEVVGSRAEESVQGTGGSAGSRGTDQSSLLR